MMSKEDANRSRMKTNSEKDYRGCLGIHSGVARLYYPRSIDASREKNEKYL
jgi:hypothetical protein